MFDHYLQAVVKGDYLGIEEAYHTAKMLLNDSIPAVKAAAFLGALRTRKEKAPELSGFVRALYEEAITFDTDMELIDTCGTGGDGMGTFNISTASALVVAACGMPVAKHGNKAVTGKVGSADVLEALGVDIMLEPDRARHLLDKTGITFLFAPLYHPILKQVGGLRREIGIATIFNFLGPILNPFPLTYQVMGVSDAALQGAACEALHYMGRKRALVVHAEDGMDEVSLSCPTRIYDLSDSNIEIYKIEPQKLGFDGFALEAIRGGGIETNTRIIVDVLEGKPGPQRDTVILNSAVALNTAAMARDIKEGMAMAGEAIDSGKARKTLLNMISCSRDGVARC